MDLTFNLLLFAHFLGLMLVATSFFGLLGMLPGPGRDPERSRSRYLTQLGHWGIVVAVVSGGLMLWQRYGGVEGISHWFWLKMLFLVALTAGIVVAAMSARRMRAGDAVAAQRVKFGRIVAAASLVGIVLAAVLTFG